MCGQSDLLLEQALHGLGEGRDFGSDVNLGVLVSNSASYAYDFLGCSGEVAVS